MINRICNWINLGGDRRGVTALEYALIAALVAGVLATAASGLGTTISSTFTRVASSI